MRDFLKGLELDKETIDSIMAEYGKSIQSLKEDIENYKEKILNYDAKINDLKSKANENSKANKELETLKQQIADEKEESEKAQKDAILTKNIEASFGDRKFVNDFTKQAIINKVKQGLANENNAGKSAKDIFEEITKDRQDIFANPNEIKDMSGMGNTDETTDTKQKVGEIKLNPMFRNFNN